MCLDGIKLGRVVSAHTGLVTSVHSLGPFFCVWSNATTLGSVQIYILYSWGFRIFCALSHFERGAGATGGKVSKGTNAIQAPKSSVIL